MKFTIPKTSFFVHLWKQWLFKKLKLKKAVPCSTINIQDSYRRHGKTLLWLDDKLNPDDSRMDWLAYSPVGREVEVIWIKNFYEFRNWIELNGLPDGICFDHDLGSRDYNGYDCAKWLVNYCRNKKLQLPLWASQSPNPEQKVRINRFLKKYDKSIESR